MNHYIDPITNELFAYDDDQVAAGLVKEGLSACPARPSNQHMWSNGGWTSPSPAIPQSVSPLQARKALKQQELLGTVRAAVDASDEDTQMAWEYATSFDRNSPFVLGMAQGLDWTDEQVDNLFILAASL